MKKIYLLSFLLFLIGIETKAQLRSLKFDGIDDYVDAEQTVKHQKNFTIEAWISTNASGIQPICATKSYGASNAGFAFYIQDLNQLVFETQNKSISVAHTFTLAIEHVAVVISSDGTVSMYINGVVQTTSGTGVETSSLSSNTLKIGCFGDNTNYTKGTFDEFRIWNIARTATQIKHYKNIRTATGPSIYFGFDEGEAGGDNTTLNYSWMHNFAKTGTVSNWYILGVVAPQTSITEANSYLPHLCLANTPYWSHSMTQSTTSIRMIIIVMEKGFTYELINPTTAISGNNSVFDIYDTDNHKIVSQSGSGFFYQEDGAGYTGTVDLTNKHASVRWLCPSSGIYTAIMHGGDELTVAGCGSNQEFALRELAIVPPAATSEFPAAGTYNLCRLQFLQIIIMGIVAFFSGIKMTLK